MMLLLSACEPIIAPVRVEQTQAVSSTDLSIEIHRSSDQSRLAVTSLRAALEVAAPGDVILLSPGIYNISLELADLDFSAQPVTLMGNGPGVVLDGNRQQPFAFFCSNCKGLVFADLEIRNYSDFGIGFEGGSGIALQRLDIHDNGFAVTLKDWELEGYGILIDSCEAVLIQHNQVYQNGPDPRGYGEIGTGINLWACDNCQVLENESYDNIGGGLLVEDSHDVLISGNHIHGNYLDVSEDGWWDGGIWLDGGADVIIENNLIEDNLGPGIEISDEDNQQPEGYIVRNNTIRRNYFGLFIWNFGGMPPANVLLLEENLIESNIRQDIWLEDWLCPPDDPCD